MTNPRQVRQTLVEQTCRKICEANYSLDPDAMVYTGMPQSIHNFGGLAMGMLVPHKSFQKPAWKLFEADVSMILDVLEGRIE